MNSSSGTLVFSLRAVCKSFGDLKVLKTISFDVHRGECVGLIGPSGAGKTTLLKLMAGFYQPSAGGLLVEGRVTGKLSRQELRSLRRRTGFIHQSLDLVPELRVVSNVLAGRLGYTGVLGALRLLVWPRASDLVDAYRALEKVDLIDKMYMRTDSLSGGQAQRVAVARVLHQDPDAILADEPVSSVDPARARDLLELLRRINLESKKPIVISIHAVELAREFCTRLIGLRDGQILFDRPTEKVSTSDLDELYALTGNTHGIRP